MSNPKSLPALTDHKVKHLEMIHAAIARMAQNSFLVKGWTITLVAALFAMGAKDADPRMAWIGLGPAVIFWWIDAYYLWLEQGFRHLHEAVVAEVNQAGRPVELFDMKPRTRRSEYWQNLFWNASITPLYILMLVLVIAVGLFFGTHTVTG